MAEKRERWRQALKPSLLALPLLALIIVAILLYSPYAAVNGSSSRKHPKCTQLWVYTFPVQKGPCIVFKHPSGHELEKANRANIEFNKGVARPYVQLEREAHTAYDRGDYSKALFYAKQAIQLHPNSILLTNLGNIEQELGNYSSAVSYYKKALTIDPHHTAALFGIGSVLENLGNHSQALVYFKKVLSSPLSLPLRQQPHNIFVLIERADALVYMGNYSQAESIINQVLKTDPTNEGALETAGVIMLYQKNATGALSAAMFDKILSKYPNLPDALDNKANALSHLGQNTQALRLLERSISLNPRDVYAYYNEGLVLQKMGNFTGAIAAYDKALKLTPHSSDILYNKGLALIGVAIKTTPNSLNLSDLRTALKYIDETITINPGKDAQHMREWLIQTLTKYGQKP